MPLAPERCDTMRYVAIVLGIVVGLVLGALGGLRAGAWARGFAARYWTLNAAALLGSLGLDILGLFVRQPWLSYGSLGLMAGLITGLKYGYSPTLRVWEAVDAQDGEPDVDPATAPDDMSAGAESEAREDSASDATDHTPAGDDA